MLHKNYFYGNKEPLKSYPAVKCSCCLFSTIYIVRSTVLIKTIYKTDLDVQKPQLHGIYTSK